MTLSWSCQLLEVGRRGLRYDDHLVRGRGRVGVRVEVRLGVAPRAAIR